MTDRVVNRLRDLPGDPHVVTIGSFDGVHRGHRYLLERVIERARTHQAASLAITFDPLPAEVLRPDKAPTRLCTTDERIQEILRAGIDRVALLHFDENLAHEPAESFLETIVRFARPVAIVIGEDFAFGHQRRGTPEFLEAQSSLNDYELEVVQRVNPDGIELSSSAARKALAENGDVKYVAEVLGRPYRLVGQVSNGERRGRVLGYPTANLHLPDRLTHPADGIYAATVSELGRGDAHDERPALVYVGTRPTFGGGKRLVEVFLLDFNDDLYGKHLCVAFVDRIRGDRYFESSDELVAQMRRDEAAGRAIFQAHGIKVSSTDS